MVTLEMILVGFGSVIILMISYLIKLAGYFIAIPFIVLTIGWMVDHFRGTENTRKWITALTTITPAEKEVEVEDEACQTCSDESTANLPEDSVYCYHCGKKLPLEKG